MSRERYALIAALEDVAELDQPAGEAARHGGWVLPGLKLFTLLLPGS
jgi:hypothetical protein